MPCEVIAQPYNFPCGGEQVTLLSTVSFHREAAPLLNKDITLNVV